MKEITGISIAAIQKLLDQLIQKKYVERGEKDGSWRVFVTQRLERIRKKENKRIRNPRRRDMLQRGFVCWGGLVIYFLLRFRCFLYASKITEETSSG